MIQLYAICRRCNFNSDTKKRLKVKVCKNIYHKNSKQSYLEWLSRMAIQMSITQTLRQNDDQKKRTFYNDKSVNTSRRYDNHKYILT